MENKEVICAALAEPKQSKAHSLTQKILTGAAAFSAAVGTAVTPVFAQDDEAAFGSVTLNPDSTPGANAMMGKIIGVLLGISKYVGIALVVYGVYEVVMSFMQNQPEAKTKGIVMALAGAVMITLKSILTGMGLVG